MCVCMYVCVCVFVCVFVCVCVCLCVTEHSCALDLTRKASLQPSSIMQAYYVGPLTNGPGCLRPCVHVCECVISIMSPVCMNMVILGFIRGKGVRVVH